MITLSVPKRLTLLPDCRLYSQCVFTTITHVATVEIIFSWTFRTRCLTYLPQMSNEEWSHHPPRHTATKQKLTLLHSPTAATAKALQKGRACPSEKYCSDSPNPCLATAVLEYFLQLLEILYIFYIKIEMKDCCIQYACTWMLYELFCCLPFRTSR